MPYRVRKIGNLWHVFGPRDRVFGKHKTKAGAERQQAALYAQENKKTK